jgi:integrase
VTWKLCPTMAAADVTATLDMALQASGLDRLPVDQRPRLLSDNGPSYVAAELADWLDDRGMRHIRGKPYHPMTQGKIERWHLSLKSRILWTGQRQGDLLRLPWSTYDGTRIRLRQSKTGTPVSIKVGAPLKAALDAAPRICPLILVTLKGRPWTTDGFRTSWWKACSKAGVSGVTFNDLRGTAVTRLALVGCTEAEIAAITGHTLRNVRSILDANYLHRDPALGDNAIHKLETRTKFPN